VGNYVLSGGEIPALLIVDALIRVVPGVLNDCESALTDSFQDGEQIAALVIHGRRVMKVLMFPEFCFPEITRQLKNGKLNNRSS